MLWACNKYIGHVVAASSSNDYICNVGRRYTDGYVITYVSVASYHRLEACV